jgi:hypothetical protein
LHRLPDEQKFLAIAVFRCAAEHRLDLDGSIGGHGQRLGIEAEIVPLAERPRRIECDRPIGAMQQDSHAQAVGDVPQARLIEDGQVAIDDPALVARSQKGVQLDGEVVQRGGVHDERARLYQQHQRDADHAQRQQQHHHIREQ